jgi:urease accessory protein
MARQTKSESVPRELRAQGRLIATFERARDGTTGVASLEEGGGYRMRFARAHRSRGRQLGRERLEHDPKKWIPILGKDHARNDNLERDHGSKRNHRALVSATCEGAIINTGGGMAGGDHLSIAIEAGCATKVLLSTPAAERIYRSTGLDTQVEVDLRLGARARLAWLPQETILFSGARLRRRLSVDMHDSATLIIAEATVFGRLAMGETLGKGLFADRWRIRRGGTLMHAEDTRIAGDIGRLLERPAIGGGARAIATAIVFSPDAEDKLEAARAQIGAYGCEWGASAWKGRLLARFLANDTAGLRAALVRFLLVATDGNMPRLWAANRDLAAREFGPGVDGSSRATQDFDWNVGREVEVEPDPA